MFFIYRLEQHELILLFVIFCIVAVVCYHFAVKSRKSYSCPECGEKMEVEHMEASRCSMCGALLEKDQ